MNKTDIILAIQNIVHSSRNWA